MAVDRNGISIDYCRNCTEKRKKNSPWYTWGHFKVQISQSIMGFKPQKMGIIQLMYMTIFYMTFCICWAPVCCGFLLDGSQTSFAQFRKWFTGLNGSLELEFKTEQPNGLVLYTDDGGTYDFFELKLVEGALRLRYNLGGGAQIITVGRDLHDGHWHKVQVSHKIIIYFPPAPTFSAPFWRKIKKKAVL